MSAAAPVAGAAALPTQLAAATTPYRQALTHSRHPVVDGTATIPAGLRDAVVLVALRRALTDRQLTVVARLGSRDLPPVTFVAFSDVDTWLPLLAGDAARPPDGAPGPAPDPEPGGGALSLDVLSVDGERALAGEPPVASDRLDDDEAATLVELVVVQGLLARVLLLGEVEKQRLRTGARAIAAGRELRLATGSLLDLYGADRGVPRRQDRDPAGAGDGTGREADADYRTRLALYAQHVVATPRRLAELLDGAAPGDPTGLPSLAGVTSRFQVTEGTLQVDLGIALTMVGSAGAAATADALAALHRALDEHRLVPAGGAVPASRVLPPSERARLDALAERLGDALDVSALGTARGWLAPQTAQRLDLALRVLSALGRAAPVALLAAHDPARDSRFALGLVAAVRPLPAADVAALVAAATALTEAAPGPDAGTAADDVAGVLASLQPRDASDDPLATWLWRACGFRTVLLDGGELLLSPLSVGRIVLGVPPVVARGSLVVATAQFRSLRGTGRDDRADDALDELAAACARRSVPDLSPSVLAPADAQAALEARAAPGADTLPDAVRDAGAAWGAVAGGAATALAGQLLGAELPETVVIALPAATLGAAPDPAAQAAGWVAALGDCGFASVRGLWDPAGDRLLVVAALTRILGPGTGAARAATYRWRVSTPAVGAAAPLGVVGAVRGPRVTLAAQAPGAALVVVAVPRRTGAADPYQVVVTLPGGADGPQLDPEQYGYVMNLLEQVYPVGVEVSTYDLRRNHVDVDADGRPDFLSSAASRTYLRYRRRRPVGAPPTAPEGA